MPSPTEIRATRESLGLSQWQAGELVGCAISVGAHGQKTCRAWRAWESGVRNMPGAKWELFQLKAAAIQRESADSRPHQQDPQS